MKREGEGYKGSHQETQGINCRERHYEFQKVYYFPVGGTEPRTSNGEKNFVPASASAFLEKNRDHTGRKKPGSLWGEGPRTFLLRGKPSRGRLCEIAKDHPAPENLCLRKEMSLTLTSFFSEIWGGEDWGGSGDPQGGNRRKCQRREGHRPYSVARVGKGANANNKGKLKKSKTTP